MSYWWTTVWVLIAAGAAALENLRFGKGEKIDKGFALFYGKLSYRRKWIRTLWLLPLLPLILIGVQLTFKDALFSFAVGAELVLIFLIQFLYNYKKWKEEL